jgi:FtsP/CotA-like multicopper oxidase with cupredoxin domain
MNYSKDKKTTSVALIAIFVASALLGVVMLTLSVTIPPQQEAMAQQQSNMTTTTITNQSLMPATSNKTFYVFSAEVEGLNETAAGVAGDIYTLPVIVVNRGDSVTVHFYNTEPTEEETVERHSFTIDAQPYSVNIDIAPGESGNATFTADQEGIFPIYCIYHLPTMTGQLVVLPSSSPGAVAAAAAASSPAT